MAHDAPVKAARAKGYQLVGLLLILGTPLLFLTDVSPVLAWSVEGAGTAAGA